MERLWSRRRPANINIDQQVNFFHWPVPSTTMRLLEFLSSVCTVLAFFFLCSLSCSHGMFWLVNMLFAGALCRAAMSVMKEKDISGKGGRHEGWRNHFPVLFIGCQVYKRSGTASRYPNVHVPRKIKKKIPDMWKRNNMVMYPHTVQRHKHKTVFESSWSFETNKWFAQNAPSNSIAKRD